MKRTIASKRVKNLLTEKMVVLCKKPGVNMDTLITINHIHDNTVNCETTNGSPLNDILITDLQLIPSEVRLGEERKRLKKMN